MEHQIEVLNRRLGFDDPKEAHVAGELVRASEAARRLGIPTKDLLRLVYDRKIRFLMVDGIAHIPPDAVEEYRTEAS